MKGGHGAEQCLQHLAGKHAPEIPLYTEAWNGEKHEEQAQQEAYDTEQKGLNGFAQAVQYAVQHTGDVHEGTEEAECQDEAAGKFRAVEQTAGHPSEKKKHGGAEKTQKQTAAYGSQDGAFYRRLIAACVRFGDNR